MPADDGCLVEYWTNTHLRAHTWAVMSGFVTTVNLPRSVYMDVLIIGGSSRLFQNKPYKAYDVVMPTDLLTVAARPVAPPARKRQRFDEDLSNPASSRLSFVPKSVISTGGHATPITLSESICIGCSGPEQFGTPGSDTTTKCRKITRSQWSNSRQNPSARYGENSQLRI